MMFIKRNLIAIITMLSLSMSSFSGETSVKLNTIVFSGNITDEGYLKFKEVVENNFHVDEVVLMSGGGSLLAGMAMGKLIKSKNLNVRVVGLCASACANYLFVAGNKKFIARDSLIFFHGVVQQEALQENIQNLKGQGEGKSHGASVYDDGKGSPPDYILETLGMKKVNTLAEALPQLIVVEKKYFVEMKVNNELPTFGQKGVYRDLWNSKKYEAFYYDLESMGRLGIKNIELEDGEWHPEKSLMHSYLYQVKYP